MTGRGSAEDGAGTPGSDGPDGAEPQGHRGGPRGRPRRPVISSVTGEPIDDWSPDQDAWRDRPVFDATTRDEKSDSGDESNTRRLLEDRPPHWGPTDRDDG